MTQKHKQCNFFRLYFKSFGENGCQNAISERSARKKKLEFVGLNYRNGVPPLKKLPERRSAAFRLNYSTAYSIDDITETNSFEL